jgi:hypothetical protein
MKIFRAVFFLFVLMGCRHEPLVVEEEGPPLYDQQFIFLMSQPIGTNDVYWVTLESRSYKANADSTFVRNATYRDPDHFSNPEGFDMLDSINHFHRPGYSIGSKKWFSVQVSYFNLDLPIGEQNYRTQIFELDSNWVFCNEPEDFTEKFVWPIDTLRYIKTFDEFFN